MNQPTKRQTPVSNSRAPRVVMGQGTITPAVREHLARHAPTQPAPRTPRKTVTMGQGTITPAVRAHLAQAAKR